ncbi:MAG: Bax inhibitor-1/YccA family protein [Chitinispirillaceae bacterium]|nr:Bax inhibitor-1/YccA family protein [Chitinispirillaceae bacterium]
MSSPYNEQVRSFPVAEAVPSERAEFIRKTYLHLAGAVAAFVGLEYVLIQSPLAPAMMRMISGSRYGWLMILGGFMLLGWMARNLASGSQSRQMQYAGLGLYVLVEAIVFVPILYIATMFSSPDVLPTAAFITGALFVGLTATVFMTRKDFSFLSSILTIGGFVALGLIVAGTIFGFSLGLAFSGGMVLLAAGSILYDTSKVMNHHNTENYVGASLELFASVALLFWYVLQIVMRMSRR